MKIAGKFLFFWDFILPFPLLGVMIYLWHLRVGDNYLFITYVLLLPFLFGYIGPGIGTNILKYWRFKGHWMMGNYHTHHGFMYSPTMCLIFYIAFGDSPEITAFQAFTIIVSTGIMIAFGSSQHDILALKQDKVEVFNRPTREGKSPEEIVQYYGPLCFSIIGATYGGSCVLAYQELVIKGGGLDTFWWLLGFGLIIMLSIPSIPYYILQNR